MAAIWTVYAGLPTAAKDPESGLEPRHSPYTNDTGSVEETDPMRAVATNSAVPPTGVSEAASATPLARAPTLKRSDTR